MGGVKDGIVRVGRRLQLRMFPEETFCRKTHDDLTFCTTPDVFSWDARGDPQRSVRNVRRHKPKAKAQRSVYPAIPGGKVGRGESSASDPGYDG